MLGLGTGGKSGFFLSKNEATASLERVSSSMFCWCCNIGYWSWPKLGSTSIIKYLEFLFKVLLTELKLNSDALLYERPFRCKVTTPHTTFFSNGSDREVCGEWKIMDLRCYLSGWNSKALFLLLSLHINPTPTPKDPRSSGGGIFRVVKRMIRGVSSLSFSKISVSESKVYWPMIH